jgi:hypothetical protein
VIKLKAQGMHIGLINKATLNVYDDAMMAKLAAAPMVLVAESFNVNTGLGSRFGTELLKRGFKGRYNNIGTHREGSGGLWQQMGHQGLIPITSIAFNASAEGVPANANLDALSASSDGHLQLSFERTLTVSGVVAFDHDVIDFNPVTHSYVIARALGTENAAWWRADLDAIAGASVATADRTFRDGFE